MAHYTQIPYGTSSAGITLAFGDTVPSDAVNLAYVQTALSTPIETLEFKDDLANPNEFAGNSPTAAITQLAIINGEVLDPLTYQPWVAPTDNVLFTTVTAPYTDAAGSRLDVALFYRATLRFPVAVATLSPELQTALQSGLSPAASFYQSMGPDLSQLVTITTPEGKPLPSGYLWTVMPEPYLKGQPELGLTVYTNFRGSANQAFRTAWGGFQETLNVHPVYYQSLTRVGKQLYQARPIIDNSVGGVASAQNFAGSATARITSASASAQSTVLRTIAVANHGTPAITAVSQNALQTDLIGTTSDTPSYTNGPQGFLSQGGQPVAYGTDPLTVAPQDPATALGFVLSTLSCTSDANGLAYVQIQVLDPHNQVLRTWPRVTTAAAANLLYYSPTAVAGSYTWVVQGLVDDSPGIQAGIGAGTYTYTCTWAGYLSYSLATSITYQNRNGQTSSYQTPTGTLAPVTNAVGVSLVLTTVSCPIDPNGSTSYTVTLTGPDGIVKQTWAAINSAQSLAWFDQNAPAGSYTWSATPVVANTASGVSSYNCNFSGALGWYVLLPSTDIVYTNQDGVKSSYPTTAETLAPLSTNTQLSLDITGVTIVPADSHGSSALRVRLLDPRGTVLQTWNTITTPTLLVYHNLAAVDGAYTWQIWAICTNVANGTQTYTNDWAGTTSWYSADPSAQSHPLESRPIGFTFAVGTPPGTLYSTIDDGPQIYLEEPVALTSQENWYPRLHRGWLAYTDPTDHTYLVGVEPYYKQNFHEAIPVIRVNQGLGEVLDGYTVRVAHSPLLVDPTAPIDIIISRRGGDLWITRDTQRSSGAYIPTLLADIDAGAGTIRLVAPLFFPGDIVHVVYSYLEYSYTYRGFPDQFGRFVHLDVNPAGEHTWMNLWNIASTKATLPLVGQDAPSITATQSLQDQPIAHTAVQALSQTTTLTSSPGSVELSHLVSDASTLTVSASASTIAASGSQTVSKSSTSAILATPSTSQVPVLLGQDFLNVSDAALNWVTSRVTSTVAHGATATNAGKPTVTLTTTSTTTLVSTTLAASATRVTERCTWHDPTGKLDTGYWQCLALEQSFGRWTFTASVAPKTLSTQIKITVTDFQAGIPQGVYLALLDPTGKEVARWQEFDKGSFVVYYDPGAIGGLYTLVMHAWEIEYDDSLDISGVLSSQLTPTITIAEVQTTTKSSSTAGSALLIKTGATTRAPLTTADQLALRLSNLVLPQDANATCVMNVQLLAPNGTVLVDQHDITSPTTINYSHPAMAALVPGVYTWKMWASANSKGVHSASYVTSATGTASWNQNDLVTTRALAVVPGKVTVYKTGVNTLAPKTADLALTCTLSDVVLRTNANGHGIYEVILVDTQGNEVQTWDTLQSAQTLSWYDPKATSGVYEWKIFASVVSANRDDDAYPASAKAHLGWYTLRSVTTYTYSGRDGTPYRFSTGTVVAPTGGATHLQLDLTTLHCPTDSHGSSALTVTLTDPGGATVGSWPALTTPTLLTYADPAAILGNYQWALVATATPNNTGVSSYPVSFTGTFHYTNLVTTIVYPITQSGGSSFATPSTTAAPVNAGSQLTFLVSTATLPVKSMGSSELLLTLRDPSSVQVGSWAITAPTTITYSAGGAPAGIYTWQYVFTEPGPNTGAATYACRFTGSAQWYQATTTYLQTDGSPQTLTVPTPAATLVAPTTAALALTLNLTSVVCPSNANGESSFTVTLQDPANAPVKTWHHLKTDGRVSWWDAGASTGTYHWVITATCTNHDTGTGSFLCTAAATSRWIQTDAVPVTVYLGHNGTIRRYTTDQFTVAPESPAQAFRLKFTHLVAPADTNGTTSLTVTLRDPNDQPVNTWTQLRTPQELTYWLPVAPSGPYTWTIQGVVQSLDRGTEVYTVQWAATLTYLTAVDDEVPTYELVEKSLYLYLTVDGYPFHAVLDPLDDPHQPLVYDTNRALAGTRYAAMPTIHAF